MICRSRRRWLADTIEGTGGHVLAQRQFTLEDYWAVELGSPLRHEFLHGAIFAMAGGTARHNEVAANVQYALRVALDATRCRPVGPDQRLRVSETEYTYADVTVFCGLIDIAPAPPPDTATNPSLIVEVLSDSTRAYDHGEKLSMYQRMPSVQAIWLIEPERVHVTAWHRGDAGWDVRELVDPAGALDALGAAVPLHEVYARTLT